MYLALIWTSITCHHELLETQHSWRNLRNFLLKVHKNNIHTSSWRTLCILYVCYVAITAHIFVNGRKTLHRKGISVNAGRVEAACKAPSKNFPIPAIYQRSGGKIAKSMLCYSSKNSINSPN